MSDSVVTAVIVQAFSYKNDVYTIINLIITYACTPVGIVITRVCWLVRYARCSACSNVQQLYKISLLTFEISRSKFKVKTAMMKNLQIVILCNSGAVVRYIFTKFGEPTGLGLYRLPYTILPRPSTKFKRGPDGSLRWPSAF